MEIIEKKVYEEGGENRRSTRERANAGLTLGIIGTVLGAAALWGRGNGIGSILGGGAGFSGGASTPANVNINAYGTGAGNGCVAPTSFQAWDKGCEDALELTNAMWGLKLGSMQAIAANRETDIAEKFSLYKTMVDADFGLYKNNRDNIDAVNNRLNSELFGLYKYTRDKDDETRKELCDLKAQVAISNAVRPYQDKLIQCEIEKAFTAGINYVDRKTCKMVEGVVVVPTEPTITGIGSYCCFRNQTSGGSTPAA